MNDKDKKLVITPLEDSKQLNQVLANDTCRKILDVISDEPLSISQISRKLNIPLTTVDYGMKKLDSVGLLRIDHKQWSPKGRKVNFYAPQEKFVVIAPRMERSQILSILKSLVSVVTGCAIVSGAVEWITRPKPVLVPIVNNAVHALFEPSRAVVAFEALKGGVESSAGEVASIAAGEGVPAAASLAQNASQSVLSNASQLAASNTTQIIQNTTETAQQFTTFLPRNQHYGMWLFSACLIVITLYVIIKYYRGVKK